ncbi:MAG TPA: twin transmembrane helix small protein [Acetobacteraceae bacterium]|nr:twin transmembrane helix small protein [Acetobacteraceae bacterium]
MGASNPIRPRRVKVPDGSGGGFRHCGRPGAGQLQRMVTLLTILVILGLLATLGTLFAGILGLASESGAGRSNALMRWRVLVQGVTIGLFVLLLLLTRN